MIEQLSKNKLKKFSSNGVPKKIWQGQVRLDFPFTLIASHFPLQMIP